MLVEVHALVRSWPKLLGRSALRPSPRVQCWELRSGEATQLCAGGGGGIISSSYMIGSTWEWSTEFVVRVLFATVDCEESFQLILTRIVWISGCFCYFFYTFNTSRAMNLELRHWCLDRMLSYCRWILRTLYTETIYFDAVSRRRIFAHLRDCSGVFVTRMAGLPGCVMDKHRYSWHIHYLQVVKSMLTKHQFRYWLHSDRHMVYKCKIGFW